MHNNPASVKFCNQCGDVLEIRHEMEDDVKIQGFFYGSGGLKFADDDWDGLRASLLEFIARTGCKDEPPDSDVEGPRDFEKSIGAIEVIEDFGEKVWCLQNSIRNRFRDGRPIQQLVDKLRTGVADPMLDEELIISVAKVNIRTQGTRYYTFDHRRLWCMHWGGCRALRVRIRICGPTVDEMFNKADGLGRPLQMLKVRN